MIRRESRFMSILLSVILLFGMMGYISIDNTYAASKKTHLKKTTVSLVVGKTYQQKLINKKGKTIKATKVKWKSKKTSVAKIDKKGKIKAVKAGTAKMTAKYKGKTYKFKVVVTNASAGTTASSPTAIAQQLYNYVYNYGFGVNEDYVIPGDRCIESEVSYYSNYSDRYIISINTSNPSTIYFGLFRTIIEPDRYKDTTETTVLQYDMNSSTGVVSFFQQYYTSSSYSSWSSYYCKGIISYQNYTAANYYTERGITDITVGYNHNPVEVGSYNSKDLVNNVKVLTTGMDKMLYSSFNIRLRNLGFSNL